MTSTPILLRVLRAVGVENPANFALLTRARLLRRRLTRQDISIRDAYLAKASEPRLHIGGGWRSLDGWLNADIALVPGVFHMDATRTFPLPSDTFAFVFSEHMIEHISYENSMAMLDECFRVMSKGAVIRIVTPDLRAILSFYDRPWSPTQQAYFDFFGQHFIPNTQPALPGALANAMVRSWGHSFIYDEDTLRTILERAGFADVVRCKLGKSAHPQLRSLENEERYPPGLLNFESIAVEAIKP
jgi:predicted SAM-dependent methyltransferase